MTTDLTQFASSGKTLYTQTFTSSGTWTRPSGVDQVWISGSGGGGGGSGSSSRMGGYQGAYTQNGGGGHAGYWIHDMPLIVSGNLTVTIGSGGAGLYGSGNATAGGDTSITHGGIVVVNCNGGAGGVQGSNTPSQGDDYGNLYAGGRGGKGYYYHYSGSTGGDNAIRIHRPVGSYSYGEGAGGGSNPYGSGGNGATNGNGGAASGNGGGGGGAGKSSVQSGYTLHRYTGGAGKAGIIIVKWLA